MKKIYLRFKEFELGFLMQEDNKYVWIPDSRTIDLCFQKYDGVRDMFFLNSIEKEVYKQIPHHFEDFFMAIGRVDLIEMAKIKSTDSDFEKLYKVASLKYFNQDFYITI